MNVGIWEVQVSRKILYPEGSAQVNAIVPAPVKEILRRLAQERRQSMSQLVTLMLEEYLHRRGVSANNDRS